MLFYSLCPFELNTSLINTLLSKSLIMQGTLYYFFVIFKVKSTHAIIYVSKSSRLSLIKVNFNVVNNNYEFLNICLE